MTKEELLKIYFQTQHIMQSKPWGEFKTLMGTRAVTSDKLQVTIHKLPFGFGVGYAPKIRPEDLDLDWLYEVGKKNNCIFVKLDVPHTDAAFKIPDSRFKIQEGKSIFAQSTLLLDLTKGDDELLSSMHEKTRYNLRLAQKKGVKVKTFSNLSEAGAKEALEEFIRLQKDTARRQKFLVHPDRYYRACFEVLSSHQMAYLLSASIPTTNYLPAQAGQLQTSNPSAASWMLFCSGDILYYPYGESNYEFRSYMPSNLLMWEAVQLGKKLGCKVFDLWGAANDPSDENDPWHGFTRFKMSFGAAHVKLAPTYDLIINKGVYNLFETANNLRWQFLRMFK